MIIEPFRDELQPAFAALNYLWLERTVGVEELDRKYIEHPREMILAGGGEVFFAIDGGHVIGTIAAVRRGDVVEMAKFCVADSAQRRGVGRLLVEHLLEFSRSVGASKVTLSTSSKLLAAAALYESMGFVRVESTDATLYDTADVFMELPLR